jgi:DNA-binding GntR family transcriptional regulator
MTIVRAPAGPAQNLSDLAYATLSRMIHNRELRPREPILESRLAEQLNISRTPLREALQRLEGENLVVKEGGRSYVVREVDLAEYLHSLRVREILEPEAASLSVGHIDPEETGRVRLEILALNASRSYVRDAHWSTDAKLHGLFANACGNPVMADLIRSLRATTHLFEIARLKDRLIPDNAEHLAILDVQTHLRSLYRFAVSVVG